MLTQERVRELFDYREDGELIWKVRLTNNVPVGRLAGTVGKKNYRQVRIDGKIYFNHRVVFLYHHGFLPETCVDHIDRDATNNRIENLRAVGYMCNTRNAGMWPNNTSGVRGVYWNSKGHWQSQIKVRGMNIGLGVTTDFVEAVALRLAAEQFEDWPNCNSSSSAYLYMQKYLSERRLECQWLM